eukprot:CAMPEP_0182444130 /NCGR_PEP_ID=MMETSP1172-20130603/2679_1 /TAXON_ID=708627 /ORGANISM="Timspurckia oligopyrenoides, Strain CCMP3278" /LENGTH=194 /DNA_ID=CAMNT_0024639619 /DNA_START=658 /DNA_END=1242 /DNA_ORIENTATION=+
MKKFLQLPCPNSSRLLYTKPGRSEREALMSSWRFELHKIYTSYNQLSLSIEALKLKGLPGNEAARMNQYLMLLQWRFNELRYIKGYRTPEGIRAFAKIFIMIHSLFYGSYYAFLAQNVTLLWALLFAYMAGIAMVGLVNIERALEDPFNQNGLDKIRVEKMLNELLVDLKLIVVRRDAVVTGILPFLGAEFETL